MTTEDSAKSLDDFGRQVRAAGRILWRGDDPNAFLNFVDSLNAAVFRGYEQAWREGAQACGLLPGDRTPEEQAILAEYLSVAQSRIMPLGDFIQAHNRAAGGKWSDLQPRLNIWINRYNEVRARAQAVSCPNIKEEWIYGDTVAHCNDCSAVVGRVYRSSVWNAYGWFPQGKSLACGGWRCDCKRIKTDKPVTPGRPPAVKGK